MAERLTFNHLQRLRNSTLKKVELILHSTSLFQENYLSLQKVVRFLAEKPHEEGYGQRPRVVERAEFRGFRQMKISGLTRLAVR